MDTAVKRSNRFRANNNGFKVDICKAKNCPGCSSTPPTLFLASLKNIGVSLCQLNHEELEEQELLKKKIVKPIGKKPKKDADKKDEDEENTN